MKLSVIIPAHNEEGSIKDTVIRLSSTLSREQIQHELIVCNDHSSDRTLEILSALTEDHSLVIIENMDTNGYGHSVRSGLRAAKGDCMAIFMADLSDDPEDLVLFYRAMIREDVDCVFGSRFIKGASVHDYPKFKMLLNRIFNTTVRLVFGFGYNDCTNAFKLYSRSTIEGIQPLLSPHFNLTLEMPLKAIVRGYSYTVLPNSWRNRATGISKLKIKEMGSRYFFILLYCLIEKYFSKNDYTKPRT